MVDEEKGRMISVRFPVPLLDEIDRLIASGQAQSRSEFLRRIASMHLVLESPEMKRAKMKVDAAAIPLMATMAQTFDSIMAELEPSQLKKLVKIIIDPLAGYYSRVLQIPASEIKRQLLKELDKAFPESQKGGKKVA